MSNSKENKLTLVDLSGSFQGLGMYEKRYNYTEKSNHQKFEWQSETSTAQFDICPIWKGGLIKEVYIYPVDQPGAKHYYYVKCEQGFEGIDFEHLHYKYDTIKGTQSRINFPVVWKTYWCKDHKTQAIRFYVPRHTLQIVLLITRT